MTLNVFYNDFFDVPLKEGHRFPMKKYRLIREMLLEENILTESHLKRAEICSIKDLYLAHDPNYVDDVIGLKLDAKIARGVGLPLNADMVNRALSSMDAVIKAAYSALENGFSASICGGTHHASYAKGEGFCYFNDFAVVCRKLYLENPLIKILILDMDVHQGNGNSSILANDDYVDIVSFHGAKNYPFRKVKSSIDVEFDDNTEDLEYLSKLNITLSTLDSQKYDLILYQAGVDSLIHDKLGHLNLSFEGLKKRDEMIFKFANNTPLSMALGGGYSNPIDQTVKACVNCYRVAKEFYKF